MAGDEKLKDGDEVRLIGTGGAPVLLTVGRPFSAQEIEKRLGSGEWRREGEEAPESDAGPQPRTEKLSQPADDPGTGPKPRTEKLSKPEDDPEPGRPQPRREFLSEPGHRPDQEVAQDGDPGRPADSAPKAEWVAYTARTQQMTREDAANYTKADLIDMAG
jgi:hypothetical protein